jgi:tetratricopeptide (TPR) repeat protein
MRWRREQAGKQIIIVPALLICIFLLGGCNGGNKEPKGINKAVSEKKKAKLLKRIDRKYEDVEAHYNLGRLYQAEGRWLQAENQYGVALNFDPVHRPSQAARVKVLMSSGDATKASLLADEYIKQASISAAGSLQLALAFQEQGVDDYALKCYQQALYLAPNSAKINRQIGFYYLSRGNKDMAREYLSRSFQLNPNQSDVAGELGRLGVVVRIPRKTSNSTSAKKLDKMVDQSDKGLKSR